MTTVPTTCRPAPSFALLSCSTRAYSIVIARGRSPLQAVAPLYRARSDGPGWIAGYNDAFIDTFDDHSPRPNDCPMRDRHTRANECVGSNPSFFADQYWCRHQIECRSVMVVGRRAQMRSLTYDGVPPDSDVIHVVNDCPPSDRRARVDREIPWRPNKSARVYRHATTDAGAKTAQDEPPPSVKRCGCRSKQEHPGNAPCRSRELVRDRWWRTSHNARTATFMCHFAEHVLVSHRVRPVDRTAAKSMEDRSPASSSSFLQTYCAAFCEHSFIVGAQLLRTRWPSVGAQRQRAGFALHIAVAMRIVEQCSGVRREIIP